LGHLSKYPYFRYNLYLVGILLYKVPMTHFESAETEVKLT